MVQVLVLFHLFFLHHDFCLFSILCFEVVLIGIWINNLFLSTFYMVISLFHKKNVMLLNRCSIYQKSFDFIV
jgi:hypothetical protein